MDLVKVDLKDMKGRLVSSSIELKSAYKQIIEKKGGVLILEDNYVLLPFSCFKIELDSISSEG